MNKDQIEQLALELAEELGESYSMFDKEFVLDPIQYSKAFLAIVDAERAKEKPVGYFYKNERGFWHQAGDPIGFRAITPLYFHPQPIHEGWKEAAIAWEVCASIHREYAKSKDALFITRQQDFLRHAKIAREAMLTVIQEIKP